MVRTKYYISDNDRCRFRHVTLENEDHSCTEYYEVAMIEVFSQSEYCEVFYLERFKELENAIKAMSAKGVDFDAEYNPYDDDQEIGYWFEACI